MSILALDLGTRTGWALHDGARIESGVQVFDLRRGESAGMRYYAFNRWLEHIGGWPAGHGELLVVYEAAHHRGGAATELLNGFTTRIQEWTAIQRSVHNGSVDHAAVHSATLKKWTTGKGNADKAAMIAAVRSRFGWRGTDDNEADALALLHYALEELVGTLEARGDGLGRQLEP